MATLRRDGLGRHGRQTRSTDPGQNSPSTNRERTTTRYNKGCGKEVCDWRMIGRMPQKQGRQVAHKVPLSCDAHTRRCPAQSESGSDGEAGDDADSEIVVRVVRPSCKSGGEFHRNAIELYGVLCRHLYVPLRCCEHVPGFQAATIGDLVMRVSLGASASWNRRGGVVRVVCRAGEMMDQQGRAHGNKSVGGFWRDLYEFIRCSS